MSAEDAWGAPPAWSPPPAGDPGPWGAPAAAPPPEAPAPRRQASPQPAAARDATGAVRDAPRRPRDAGPDARPAPPRSGRVVDAATGRSVRVHVVERFPGQRVHQQSGPWRRIRAGLALLVAAVLIGIVVAAALSVVVWGLSTAVHHASSN